MPVPTLFLALSALVPAPPDGSRTAPGPDVQAAASAPPQAVAPAAPAPSADEPFALDDNLGRLEQIPGPELWTAWIARDERVGFNAHSAVVADRALAGDASPAERACAVLVLALINGGAARPFLLERVKQATGVERRAAVLALGETGVGVESILTGLIDDPEVADDALLALLHLSQASTRQFVIDLVQGGEHPLAATAEKLLVFNDAPTRSVPATASALWLNLRWHAARLYGTIDGQVWRMIVYDRLLRDKSFVQEAVLRSVGELRHPGVPDLVLELLLEGTQPARVRAAVACLPRQLATLVSLELDPQLAGGFWKPANLAEWSALLDEVEARRLEFEMIELLVAASELPELRFRALALISRTGAVGELEFDGNFEGLSAADKLWACEAMGNTGEKRWLAVLEPLRDDPDAGVRAASRVAQVRLSSERARDEVAEQLDAGDPAQRAALVGAMCRTAQDPRIADWLERLLRRAEGPEAVRIATALAAEGRLDARSQLHELLRDDPPRGAQGAAVVRALATSASRDDVELIGSLFPRADDFAMNVALAVALVDAGSVEVLPLVRKAIWDEAGALSILAAGLLAERGSVASLVDELGQPPEQATSEDIRRLGFALGVWGGIREVQALARSLRYNSGHPAVQGALLGALSQRTR